MVAVAALASGCLVSPVMHFGGGKSHEQVEHETVRSLTPPALTVDGTWHGPVRTATIRVYADGDYRGQNTRWTQTFQQVLDDANQVLVGDYGVRLVADFRTWDRHEPTAELSDSLAALGTLNPGNDVLTVVGLTSSMPLTSGAFEQLGLAELGGRHLIVRGYADVEERAAFERAFTDIDDDERDGMYVARRRHRNATLLLHELGHNLGVAHSAEPDTIMSAVYSARAASFDPESRAAILTALDARLNTATEPPPPPPPVHRACVDPPPPAHGTPPATDEHAVLVIGVDRRGHRITHGDVLDDAALDELLATTAQEDPATQIEVHPMPGAPASALRDLVARVRAACLQRVRTVNPR